MKKKMRRFEEGGLSKAQEDWLGGADRTDPYIMARMRRAVPDEPKSAPAMPKADAGEIRDETGTVSKMRRNTETGELYSTDTSETKTVPKATSSAAPKTEAPKVAAPKAEPKTEAAPETKKTAKEQMKEAIKPPKLPGSFSSSKAGANTEKKAADVSEFKKSLGASIFPKSQRTVAAEKSSGMRAGGKVSSASSRGDGCAMRGKTRGRIV